MKIKNRLIVLLAVAGLLSSQFSLVGCSERKSDNKSSKQVQEQKKTLSEKEAEITKLKAEVAALKKQSASEKAKIEEQITRAQKAEENVVSLQAQLADINAWEQQLSQKEAKLNQKEATLNALKASLVIQQEEAQQAVADAKSAVNELKAQQTQIQLQLKQADLDLAEKVAQKEEAELKLQQAVAEAAGVVEQAQTDASGIKSAAEEEAAGIKSAATEEAETIKSKAQAEADETKSSATEEASQIVSAAQQEAETELAKIKAELEVLATQKQELLALQTEVAQLQQEANQRVLKAEATEKAALAAQEVARKLFADMNLPGLYDHIEAGTPVYFQVSIIGRSDVKELRAIRKSLRSINDEEYAGAEKLVPKTALVDYILREEIRAAQAAAAVPALEADGEAGVEDIPSGEELVEDGSELASDIPAVEDGQEESSQVDQATVVAAEESSSSSWENFKSFFTDFLAAPQPSTKTVKSRSNSSGQSSAAEEENSLLTLSPGQQQVYDALTYQYEGASRVQPVRDSFLVKANSTDMMNFEEAINKDMDSDLLVIVRQVKKVRAKLKLKFYGTKVTPSMNEFEDYTNNEIIKSVSLDSVFTSKDLSQNPVFDLKNPAEYIEMNSEDTEVTQKCTELSSTCFAALAKAGVLDKTIRIRQMINGIAHLVDMSYGDLIARHIDLSLVQLNRDMVHLQDSMAYSRIYMPPPDAKGVVYAADGTETWKTVPKGKMLEAAKYILDAISITYELSLVENVPAGMIHADVLYSQEDTSLDVMLPQLKKGEYEMDIPLPGETAIVSRFDFKANASIDAMDALEQMEDPVKVDFWMERVKSQRVQLEQVQKALR